MAPLTHEARGLVPQRNILGDEICTILEYNSNNGEDQWELEWHLTDNSLSPNDRKKSAILPPYPIVTRHTAPKKIARPIMEAVITCGDGPDHRTPRQNVTAAAEPHVPGAGRNRPRPRTVTSASPALLLTWAGPHRGGAAA